MLLKYGISGLVGLLALGFFCLCVARASGMSGKAFSILAGGGGLMVAFNGVGAALTEWSERQGLTDISLPSISPLGWLGLLIMIVSVALAKGTRLWVVFAGICGFLASATKLAQWIYSDLINGNRQEPTPPDIIPGNGPDLGGLRPLGEGIVTTAQAAGLQLLHSGVETVSYLTLFVGNIVG